MGSLAEASAKLENWALKERRRKIIQKHNLYMLCLFLSEKMSEITKQLLESYDIEDVRNR